jgi:hypothetical protein
MQSLLTTWRERFPDAHDYLTRRLELEPHAFGLFLVLWYTYFNAGGPNARIMACALIALTLIVLRVPRGVLYVALTICVTLLLRSYVFGIANGRHDSGSDRDDAVEIGARALLQLHNPWESQSILGLPITTGPSSLFLALPFVALGDSINMLTFLFWLLFLALLWLGDLRTQNGSLPWLVALLLMPISGLAHTLFWSLDELYYGAILLPFVWLSLERGSLFLAGAVAALIALSRLSYVFGLLGLGIWWLTHKRPSLRDVGVFLAGGLSFVAGSALILRLIAGASLWRYNFVRNLLQEPLVEGHNLVAKSIVRVLKALGTSAWSASLVVLALAVPACFLLRRPNHPFFHVALPMLLAHTIAFSPGKPEDYALIVVIPAMYGVAFAAAAAHKPATVPAPEIC